MVNKIVKAKQYAQEPRRVHLHRFELDFSGDNDTHHVTFEAERWTCSCGFFGSAGICSHTMAVEQMLDPMLRVKQTMPEVIATSA